MSTTISTYDRLVTILVERFGVTAEEATPEATFEQLDLDSLALVEFTLTVQSDLSVEVSDTELSPQQTLAEVASLVESKGAEV
ncbi:phosphopantetheine-binding protein [Streptomyces ficellus]|uniref:Phosphopantetheine-binding protein n=1 Tax=Streptomyces ficellus TaxID=1977088 RepID=A0ABT7ZC35_9ACTN|nr:phosphopantetheine-binding protein [Streptomyces ficellus]MDN3297062.1 phosphopantetheine-binding protein [Streptomyces ficellus]